MRIGLLGAALAVVALLAAEAPARTSRPSTPPRAEPLAAAKLALRTGRYEEARALAVARARGRGTLAISAARIAASAELGLGRRSEARKRLEEATVLAPRDLGLRADLADLADELGDRAAVDALVALTEEEDEDGGGGRTRPPAELVARARLARLAGRWKDANALLRSAVRAAPTVTEAHVTWGLLLLEKHAVDDALASFKDALALDAADPDAQAGLARLLYEEARDHEGASRAAAAALAVNPRHAHALGVAGALALDAEDDAEVERVITVLRRSNPQARQAAVLAGARALLLDDGAGFERERAARAADGAFFAGVAEILVRQRRYEDARAIAERGTREAPAHAGCFASLGGSLLRLGDEPAGLAALRRAFELDPYDVRVFNTLELFERVVPNRYVTFDAPPFRFRVEPRARPAVEAVVAPYLEAVYDGYVARYGVVPKGPIVIELYADPAHFAVRTVGLPVLDVAAVCFGRVITAQGPPATDRSWALVLGHELAHTFALELSRGRVPRWFTEGLAELETTRLPPPLPSYRRHAELVHHAALARGELPGLAALSRAFIEARTRNALVAAYAHGTAAVELLERRHGFAAVRDALVRFGRGQKTAAVLDAVTGGRTAALEHALADELVQRHRVFAGQFLPGRVERDDADPRWVEAERALATGRGAEAVAGYERLLASGRDGYDVRVHLALALVRAGTPAAAEPHLARAAELAPFEVEPLALLAELYRTLGRGADRLAAQRRAFRLDPQVAELGRVLFADAEAGGRPDERRALAAALVAIDPSAVAALEALAEGTLRAASARLRGRAAPSEGQRPALPVVPPSADPPPRPRGASPAP